MPRSQLDSIKELDDQRKDPTPCWPDSFYSELDRFFTANWKRTGATPTSTSSSSWADSSPALLFASRGRAFGQHFRTPLEELDLSPEARRLIKDTVKFAPRSDIARVIYVTTPHRGSPIPHNPLINRAIRFIQMPRTINRRDRWVLVEGIREDLRGLFTVPANSIRFLKSGSPILEAIETLPLGKDTP